jgi:hypothetical protein
MPRCCNTIPDEFSPSYASILMAKDLESAVGELESGKLIPCITAWCNTCQAPYLLTSSVSWFKSPSAHHAHMLALAERIKSK